MGSIYLPNTIYEILSNLGYYSALVDEMQALDDNCMWNLMPSPTRKKVISCCYLFAVKFNPNGSVIRLEVHLIAKGYAQTCGIDYSHTFSVVANLSSI